MKKLGYFYDAVEFLTLELIDKVEKCREEYSILGIGIFPDDVFKEIYNRDPVKPFNERVRLAKALKGIDFVFEASYEKEFGSCISGDIITDEKSVKKYHLGYVPGTYDLFHEGHLQNILEAKSLCDEIIVGVNSDKLVWKNKQKETNMNQDTRMAIISNLKFVDYIYLVEQNDKHVANEWANKNVGKKIDLIVLGSDLKGENLQNPDNIDVYYTDRDPNIMKFRSSTYYRRVWKQIHNDD